MNSDGDLRRLFRKYLPHVHWTTIESRYTQAGIPDLNGCYAGDEFWVECKLARGWRVYIRPMQLAWIKRRVRCGGSCYIAIRRKNKKLDQLILLDGLWADQLARYGLRRIPLGALACWAGGPGNWPWQAVAGWLGLAAGAVKRAGGQLATGQATKTPQRAA